MTLQILSPSGVVAGRLYAYPEWFPGLSLQYVVSLDSIASGDTISVRPGTPDSARTYQDTLNFLGKNILVVAREHQYPDSFRAVGAPDPRATAVNALGQGSVVKFVNQEYDTAIIRGFTLTGGKAQRGAGILCVKSSPAIEKCIVRDNTTDTLVADTLINHGGGICLLGAGYGAVPTRITGCRIEGNRAWNSGGGIFCDWRVVGGDTFRTSVEMDSDTIVDNTAGHAVSGDTFGCGGGIHVQRCEDVSVSQCLIKGNVLLGNDGGGLSEIGCGTTKLTGNVIRSNSSRQDGGGVRFYDGDVVEIRCNSVVGNGSGKDGGGIYLGDIVSSTEKLIERNLVSENVAASMGGGIFLKGTTLRARLIQNSVIKNSIGGTPQTQNPDTLAGGVGVAWSTDVVLESNKICQNDGKRRGGGMGCKGGADSTNSTSVEMILCVVNENQADSGGACSFVSDGATRDLDAMIRKCRIVDNTSANPGIGGIYCGPTDRSGEFTIVLKDTNDIYQDDDWFVYNVDSDENVVARRNWWGTTDTATIKSHLHWAGANVAWWPISESPRAATGVFVSPGATVVAAGDSVICVTRFYNQTATTQTFDFWVNWLSRIPHLRSSTAQRRSASHPGEVLLVASPSRHRRGPCSASIGGPPGSVTTICISLPYIPIGSTSWLIASRTQVSTIPMGYPKLSNLTSKEEVRWQDSSML
jgi:hypothetical protein